MGALVSKFLKIDRLHRFMDGYNQSKILPCAVRLRVEDERTAKL